MNIAYTERYESVLKKMITFSDRNIDIHIDQRNIFIS